MRKEIKQEGNVFSSFGTIKSGFSYKVITFPNNRLLNFAEKLHNAEKSLEFKWHKILQIR